MTLTPEQEVVASAGVDSRQLVVAGPGTGKTHTLVARLAHLVDSCGVSPGQEILVLSFTRNAVREIRRRVRDLGGDVRYVTARTFDSFATRMLAAVEPDGAWKETGYDDRIRMFTAELAEKASEIVEHLSSLRHILVDEIQDLVGERAAMVEALLDAVPCGFTLLGDPAQAIYSYQARSCGGGTDPTVAEWARERFADLEIRGLTQNHRLQGRGAEAAFSYGPRLERRGGSSVYRSLRETYLRLPILPSLESLRLAASHGTVGIVCRINGQALLVSDLLHTANIDHTLYGDAVSAPVEGWLARALFDCDASFVTRSDLDVLVKDCGEDSDFDFDEAWRALRAMGRERKGVDLGRVAARLAARWTPDELVQRATTQIVVSSIHRAKGLEFDQVVVVVDAKPVDDMELATVAEEARVLYVAMTRAKRGLFRFDLPREWGMRQVNDRWVVRGTGKRSWVSKALQLLPTDCDRTTPDVGGSTPRDCQEYLWTDVHRGDPVILRIDPGTVRDDPPVYQVLHRGDRIIGRTSLGFAAFLRGELKSEREKWPAQISGARVSTVESTAGTRAEAERSGLRGQGFWLAVRLEGLGKYDWSVRVADCI